MFATWLNKLELIILFCRKKLLYWWKYTTQEMNPQHTITAISACDYNEKQTPWACLTNTI